MQLGDVVSTVTPCLMVTSDMNQLTAFGYADGFSVNTVKSLLLCQFRGPALHCRVWRGGCQSHPWTTPQLVHACSQHAATLGLHTHTHTHTPDDAAGRRRRQVVNLGTSVAAALATPDTRPHVTRQYNLTLLKDSDTLCGWLAGDCRVWRRTGHASQTPYRITAIKKMASHQRFIRVCTLPF